jgi:hypothetical protein
VLFANRSGRSASADITLLEMSPRQVALAIVELVREHWPALREVATPHDPEIDRVLASQTTLETRMSELERTTRTDRDALASMLARSQEEVRSLDRSVRELQREPAPPGIQIWALAGVQAFVGSSGALATIAPAIDVPVDIFRLRARATFGTGTRSVTLGDVWYVTAQASASFLISASIDRFLIAAGPTATLGFLHAEGHARAGVPFRGANADQAIGWAGLELALCALIVTSVRIGVELEIAHTFAPFRGLASDEPVAALDGAMMLARVGISFEP